MKVRAFQPSLIALKCSRIQVRHASKFDSFGNPPVPPNKLKFVPISGTYPKGFRIGSINAGIKPASKSQHDLVLLASEVPSNGAAVFTKNAFPAPSITVSKEIVRRTKGVGLRGMIANSWCANLFTGKEGLEDTLRMSREAHKYISGDKNGDGDSSVMVMHTGMGGQRLPIDEITSSLSTLHASLGSTHTDYLTAAYGLLTTDTFPKLHSRTFTLPSSPKTMYSLAGLTKGSGMIHPNMATTLGIICTDASISAPALQNMLEYAAERSYNCISVDGDTSTNDMVTLFANGAACPAPPSSPVSHEVELDPANEDFLAMRNVLTTFMQDLAQLVVRDGEGASKFITLRIRGAPSFEIGKKIAQGIAKSVLFKAGMNGKEPAWGNVVTALGQTLMGLGGDWNGKVGLEDVSVSFKNEEGEMVRFFETGEVKDVGEAGKRIMQGDDVEILVELGGVRKTQEEKGEEVLYWTCDLTKEFVDLNS